MEQLILDLNSPQNQGRPEVINVIQRQLQRLQRDQSAWQAALDLLGSTDQILQFYGALTIGLKVNADWDNDKIGENRQMVAELVQVLINCYTTLSSQSFNSDMVVNKLSAVLAAIFAKPDAAWAHPCRHVLACILAGHYLPENEAPDVVQMLLADTTLSAASLRCVLRLGLAIQEESTLLAQNKISHRYQTQVSNNAKDVWQIIKFALTWVCTVIHIGARSSTESGLQVQGTDAMFKKLLEEVCLLIPLWSKYVEASPSESWSDEVFVPSVEMLLNTLERNQVAESVMPCLTALQTEQAGLLRRYVPRFLRRINESAMASGFREGFSDGVFSSEAISYVEFLEATVSQLDLTNDAYLSNEDVRFVLQIAQDIFEIDGAAVVEDEVCQILLEMMTSIAEGYGDWTPPSQFDDGMTSLIKNTCASATRKVRYPEEQLDKTTATWDEDDFTKFEDFRFSASDFFQTAFAILGPSLGMDIALSISPQAGSSSVETSAISWPSFEAALFGLTSLLDALSNESDQCDPCLTHIFESKPWSDGVSIPEQVPSRVRRAMIRLLGETTAYLQRNPKFLISSLDFLFRSLQVRNHSIYAAKAIYNLCDSQRALLVQALPQFLQTITTLEHIPLMSRSKVLSGVAALVQALPSEGEKIEPLQKMLLLIQNLETTASITPLNGVDEHTNPMFDRVSMIAALAKGLQSPADYPINLESTKLIQNTFWTKGDGRVIQQAVIQLLSGPWNHLLNPESADLVTAACQFLKAGFVEEHPSPFKFSAASSIEMINTLINLKNPNLDQTMSTTSCFVASAVSPLSSPEAAAEADILITAVLAITKEATDMLNNPSIGPDFSAPTSILDFFNRSVPKYALYIFKHASALDFMNTIITYALLLLRGTSDTLQRRFAATFFTTFIDLSDPSFTIISDATASSTLVTLLDRYAPTVLGIVLHLLAGECARSEIETLTGTLRQFILRQQMRTKRIMQEAMKPESGVLTEKALSATKPEQRARFVAQVEGLRGAKRTNEIVREFWVSCRGGQFGYIA